MVVVLKNKTKNSPGIIVFTHNEILKGVIKKSKKINDLLQASTEKKKWLFGVHIQGDCRNLSSWPHKEWQSFFLWPNDGDLFLSNIPNKIIKDLTCVNFLPKTIENFKGLSKDIDIISVSKFSKIKNIDLTLKIFKALIDRNPSYKLLLIALKNPFKKKFFKNSREKYLEKVFKLANSLKVSKKYKNIKIIDPDIKREDLFPIPDEEIYKYISRSKFHMLNSYREGVPRVIIESLYLNTKVIFSNKLSFGLNKYMNNKNSFVYKENNENLEEIADSIDKELKKNIDYSDEFLNLKDFQENESKVRLINFLNKISSHFKKKLEDKNHISWRLNNLKFRLCSHFRKADHQILKNEKNFLKWFKIVNEDENYFDEKYHHIFKIDKIDIIFEARYFLKNLILKIKNKTKI